MFRSIFNFIKIFWLLPAIFIAFVVSCSKEEDPKVQVIEGIFINEVYPSTGEDWIELYNSTETEKNLIGYKIYDDVANKYSLPAGTLIPAKDFLILICDDTGTGLHTNFKLSSSGETIYLENSAGKIIDKVEFPILESGQSYGRYPDGSDKLGISGNTSKGSSNGDVQAPLIVSVSRTPNVPALADAVTIKAEVLSNAGISAVKLFYRLNGSGFSEVSMTKNQNFYEAQIPAMNTTGEVEYYVSAANSAGKTTLHPFNAPEKNHDYLLNTDPLPQLKINEFMAFNTSCCPDADSGVNEFDDWIEIYNAGTTAVNIGGMYLSDDKSDPFKSKVPSTDATKTTIPPGGFLILWADESGAQGVLHLSFKLSTTGEDVGIFYKDGRTIDTFTFGQQQDNVSSGLSPDGGVLWQNFSAPTPGLTNN